MASLECYLKELDKQRDLLADTLVLKGIDADESETYNSLVAKVATIPTGTSDPVIAGIATIATDGAAMFVCGVASDFSEVE